MTNSSNQDNQPMYVTLAAEANQQQYIVELSESLKEFRIVQRNIPAEASYGYGNEYLNIEPNLSVRSEYSRRDYENFRPEERMPVKPKDKIAMGMRIYKKEPLIKNIIDLMADFTCQGIEIYHPNPVIQKFCSKWWQKIGGRDRSERFSNLLYRTGNVIGRRVTAKISVGEKRKMQRIVGNADIEPDLPRKVYKNEIPWDYTFFNPLVVDVIGDHLAAMTGKYIYYISLPKNVQDYFRKNNPDVEAQLLAALPKDIRDAISSGKPIMLDQEKTFSYFYKKDDWETWADPMTFPLFEDLNLLKKMRLADLSALDGVISNVRIWKLGSLQTTPPTIPSAAYVAKLVNALANVSAGGTADLVWGPDLEFEQHIPEVDKILGMAKYEPVMQRLYEGLGVPPTLTGSQNNKGGLSNNYISLKTLIERLQYGRSKLMEFWNVELEYLQNAMGFKIAPTIRFTKLTLADEASEKKILLDMWDRNIITNETLLERLGEDHELEKLRYKKEVRDRVKGNLDSKASPFYDPLFDEKGEQKLKEVALQGGSVTPSQVGLVLDEKTAGEKTPIEMQPKPVGPSGGGASNRPKSKTGKSKGRPGGSKDRIKRKTKRTSIRTTASTVIWARNTLDDLDKHINPIYLKMVNKNNLRQLTDEESNDLVYIKFNVLSKLEPYAKLSLESVYSCIAKSESIDNNMYKLYNYLLSDCKSKNEKVSLDMVKSLQAFAYAVYITEDNESENNNA